MKAKFPTEILAKVQSTGPHAKSAVVQTRAPFWHSKLQKHFRQPHHFRVSDPSGATRRGDTVAITWWPALGRSRQITHTVTRLVAAWGADGAAPPTARPAVWTEEQRREWRRNQLLKRGDAFTRRGLADGSLAIGEAGEIVRVQKEVKEVEEVEKVVVG